METLGGTREETLGETRGVLWGNASGNARGNHRRVCGRHKGNGSAHAQRNPQLCAKDVTKKRACSCAGAFLAFAASTPDGWSRSIQKTKKNIHNRRGTNNRACRGADALRIYKQHAIVQSFGRHKECGNAMKSNEIVSGTDRNRNRLPLL